MMPSASGMNLAKAKSPLAAKKKSVNTSKLDKEI
jgi:hypothetical protein